jgi:hypothetical protein
MHLLTGIWTRQKASTTVRLDFIKAEAGVEFRVRRVLL